MAHDKVKSTPFEDLPTVKKVLSRIKQDGASFTYQGIELTKHDQAMPFFKSHHIEYVDLV